MMAQNSLDSIARHIEENGFSLIDKVLSQDKVDEIREQVRDSFSTSSSSVRHRDGEVYAVRNGLELFPQARKLWQTDRIKEILCQVLGPDYGLVRGLFFDKPPDQTWALPWHKDLLIAVKEETVSSELIEQGLYSRPRMRIGVPHTEPPLEVLQSMLTLRFHLDDMTPDNGPLEVLPDSHHTGKKMKIETFDPLQLHCHAGDVLAMSPLLVHCSGSSNPETTQHRRILHLEFAARKAMPGNVQWWEFYPSGPNPA